MKRKLQIFVSSTYQDLKDDRQAAVSAILKAGHIPAGMELFTSGDQSQMTTIKRWIDDSDVYMLILGGRYGSIEPISGVSYTELEYNYALEQGKALFAVVIDDKALNKRVKIHGLDISEQDNQQLLKLFKEKVLSNISSFFEDEKDIKLCVHESLSDFLEHRELKGWVSADEIPNTQTLFDEINKLSEENKVLLEKLSNAEKKIDSKINLNSNEEFDELSEILDEIDIIVPKNATGDKKEIKSDLNRLFYSNKETFITGLTNKSGIGNAESFLYHNMCPKLQIYGLVVNEKVASVQWRRYTITQKGSDFLAYIEKQQLLKKKKKKKEDN